MTDRLLVNGTTKAAPVDAIHKAIDKTVAEYAAERKTGTVSVELSIIAGTVRDHPKIIATQVV